jgi:hypothetical protein
VPALPESEIYLLVRTYFGDDVLWNGLREEIQRGSEDGYYGGVDFVDDSRFDGYSVEDLVAAHPHRAEDWDVLYVADESAITSNGYPLLVVRVGSDDEIPFRCRADALHEIDGNLSIANLDWDDFRDAVGESGVYGEPRQPDDIRPSLPPAERTPRPTSVRFVDDDYRRSDDVPDDWQPEPPLPARIQARRSFVDPPAWAVVLMGDNARPGKVHRRAVR